MAAYFINLKTDGNFPLVVNLHDKAAEMMLQCLSGIREALVSVEM